MTPHTVPISVKGTPRLRYQLLAFSLIRSVINTSHRMVYPFLPAISRGLGVDPQTISLAISARFTLGVISPVSGIFTDRYGRKYAMLAGLFLFTIGMLWVALSPTLVALVGALLLTALCKIIFDPAMHAYVGDRVSYRQRGLAVAITEFGWSGAFLFGIPIAGWLIAQFHWNTPFLFLGLIGAGALLIFWRILPADNPAGTDARPPIWRGMRIVLSSRAAWGMMGLTLLLNGGSEIVGIVYGVWMESAFEMQVVALGIASSVIGIAELGGEGIVAGLVDWLGKRRSVGLGLALYALACIFLPFIAQTIPGALIGLFLFYLTFEFTIVASIPLTTQILPNARATLLATNVAAVSIGRAAGTLIGPALFMSGIHANAFAAAACNVIALGLLIFLIKDTQ